MVRRLESDWMASGDDNDSETVFEIPPMQSEKAGRQCLVALIYGQISLVDLGDSGRQSPQAA
jgi:hypothetical protein